MTRPRHAAPRAPSLALLRRLLGVTVLLAVATPVACGGDEDDGSTPGATSQGGTSSSAGGTAGQGGLSGAAGSAGTSAGTAGSSAGTSSTAGSSGGGSAGASATGGQAGASGSPAGGQAGSGGSSTTGGQAGTAGSSVGGQAGSSGTSTGGQAGSAGSAAGGQAGSSAGGQAGSSAGGQAGSSAGGQAGSPAGGQAGAGGSNAAGSSGAAGAAGAGGAGPAPLGNDACDGYATRYWDCCKAHCAWAGNVPPGVSPVTSCNAKDEPITGANAANTPSLCGGPGPDSAYTCQSMTPWKVSDTLSYGYAAVPATGDICGRCYQVEFTGTSHNAGNDPGSAALKGKTMIVQATNIGYDVGSGQFDILIPGGGVGAFNACSYQWGKNDLGAQYGGFLLQCKQQNPGASHEANKACVKAKCDSVFQDPSLAELKGACAWFNDWYEAADNPNLRYAEVPCPEAIVKASGVDRGPLNDIQGCGNPGGGSTCTPEQQASCDCSWTNGGAACGTDDGSCCWKACCGPG